MNNLFNLKNQLLGYAVAAGAILLAIFKIRKGGSDAQKHKHNQATLENVAQAKQVHDDVASMSDDKRVQGRKKWTKPRK